MHGDETLSIGELARHTGVTVKTIRYYSDEGLLPEAGRSTGGHRRYAPAAVQELRRLRALRALGLPLPLVARLAAHPDEEFDGALQDAAARQLDDVDVQLRALRWREAALRLLHESPPELRAERLLLVGRLEGPPDPTVLARFWRRLLPAGIPRRLLGTIIESAVPTPPAAPEPQQVLLHAELQTLVAQYRPTVRYCAPFPAPHVEECRIDVLYRGLAESMAVTAPHLRAGHPPHEGEALDAFVAAHAHARGTRDTPTFRHALSRHLDRTTDPLIERYWHLAAALSPADGPVPGAADAWHRAALQGQLAHAG